MIKINTTPLLFGAVFVSNFLVNGALAVVPSGPVPGYVAPVTMATAPDYADSTRGVFVPSHSQHRLKSYAELEGHRPLNDSASDRMSREMTKGQQDSYSDARESTLNRIAGGRNGFESEMDRIAAGEVAPEMGDQLYAQAMQAQPYMPTPGHSGGRAHLQTSPYQAVPQQPAATAPQAMAGEGVEIAIGKSGNRPLDMNNSLVRLKEDRITVRRAVQRMMDQIGGGDWSVVWDLGEQNSQLPDMEISIFTEEPFMNVLNALLARVQSRSGEALRVIRYDNTKRLVITDRMGGHRLAGKTSPVGVGDSKVAVTENVLKETMVSIHYDEIPLVDALENIVNQAGKGEWRLRVYAGLDQVLKPAHVEEPFSIAMERLLKLFNLKYEIFPGGKLIVVTHNNRFGFKGVQ